VLLLQYTGGTYSDSNRCEPGFRSGPFTYSGERNLSFFDPDALPVTDNGDGQQLGIDSVIGKPTCEQRQYAVKAMAMVGLLIAKFARFAEHVDAGVMESAPKAV